MPVSWYGDPITSITQFLKSVPILHKIKIADLGVSCALKSSSFPQL